MANVYTNTQGLISNTLGNALKNKTDPFGLRPIPGTVKGLNHRTSTPATNSGGMAQDYRNILPKPAVQRAPTQNTQVPQNSTPISTGSNDFSSFSGGPASVYQSVTPPTVPTQNTQQPSTRGLYGEIINNLASPNNSYRSNIDSALLNLNNTAAGNQDLARNAQRIASEAGQKITDVGRMGARGQAGYLTTGTSPVGEGNAAVLAQTTAAQQQAIAQGANMELAGNEQALAAQGQQQTGYNLAGNLAVTGRGQDITGLTNAGGLASPVQVAPGSTLVSPIGGEEIAGGLGGYANYQTAEQVFSKASQYQDAVDYSGQPFIYNQAESPQQNWQRFSTQYLPNSRTYQASLNNAGLSSNIGIGGGGNPLADATVNQTNIAGYQDAYQGYQTLNAQYEGAKSLGTLLTKTMQEGGLNTADPKILNYTINQIKSQLSNVEYQKFASTLANVQSAYSNILATGGGTIPTAATNALHTIIDPNASFGAIQAAIGQLNQEVVSGKLQPMASQVNSYLGNIGGGSGGGNSTGGGGSIWDF